MPTLTRALARHCATDPRRPLLRRVGIGALSVALFAGSFSALAYRDLSEQMTTRDISQLIISAPSASQEPLPADSFEGSPVNILIMGTDARGGQAVSADGTEGMRSDTTMLMHISRDRSRIDVVSIPRDTMVPIPECRLPDGTTSYPQELGQFNSAFNIGAAGSSDTADVGYAAACTIATVQQLTGMQIPDYMVVDFDGFEAMVDALGGVPMYVPEDVDDSRAGLVLSAGCQHLDGAQALGYARARYSLGDGSDISRIGRQQQLVASIIRTAMSKNLTTDLPSLYSFVSASLATLTVSPRLGSLPTLAGLALSVKDLGMDKVNFVTMPNTEWVYDINRVVPSEQAQAVWQALREDRPVPTETVTVNGTGATPASEDGAGGDASQQAGSAPAGTDPAAGAQAPGDDDATAPTTSASPTLSPEQQCYATGR